MKTLTNGQVNHILFIKGDVDVSDSSVARLRQLGGTKNIDVPISNVIEDCSTVKYELILGFNALKNGIHMVEILDSLESVMFTATAIVDGNTSNTSHVIDDEDTTEDYVFVPPPITFSAGNITFSNDYDG